MKVGKENEDMDHSKFEEDSLENFRMMSPIDVIGDDEAVLEI